MDRSATNEHVKRVGLLLGALIPPDRLRETAARAEQLGYEELWCAEDYFYSSGLVSATTALGATKNVVVGTGIVSALVRHPALLAMEALTLSRIYPRRFVLGVGIGGPDFMRQLGLWPRSPLTAIEDTVGAVRTLLAGGELTLESPTFSAKGVRLDLMADAKEQVPIYIGGVAPKMLQLAGAIGDGHVVAFLSSPQYVEWAREQIAVGGERNGRSHVNRVVVYVFFSVDKDGARARDAVRGIFARTLAACVQIAELFDVYGIREELTELASRGVDAIEHGMPDQWLEDLAVVGDPAECAAKIKRYYAAGADTVVLYPMPDARSMEMMELAAHEVLPMLR